jgi:hypothetical protein
MAGKHVYDMGEILMPVIEHQKRKATSGFGKDSMHFSIGSEATAENRWNAIEIVCLNLAKEANRE